MVISRSGLCRECREERWIEYARAASKLDASTPAPGKSAPAAEKPAVTGGYQESIDEMLRIPPIG